MSAIKPAAAVTFARSVHGYATGLTKNFATTVKAQPEDQLKPAVSKLVRAAAAHASDSTDIVVRSETLVDGLAGRPDLGVSLDKLLVGNVELKAPGKGGDPTTFTDKRDREQWERYKVLPNLIYTDGRVWSLWRSGVLALPVVTLPIDPIHYTGAVTAADAAPLLDLLGEFFQWEPIVPSSPHALAQMLAPLCRLLRDAVLADVKAGGVMSNLRDEWRATLFPDADDPTFSDAYAQTFTYALLLARLEGAEPPLNASTAAAGLEADHALLAQVLLVLGQSEARKAIELPVSLLERVIGAVNADKLKSSKRDPWLYFYEDFLAAYDADQRNNRGVFYTPRQVVECQVRLAQSVLVDRLDKPLGFAEEDVVVLDPAAGTGTYPLSVITHAVEEATKHGGAGMAPQAATHLAANVHALELLVGPYAVAHLRISRSLADAGAVMPSDGVRVYLTDTLGAPSHGTAAATPTLFQRRLVEEQQRASKIKGETPVVVCIGNPPYDRDESQTRGTRRKGGMVRYADGNAKKPGLIKDFIEPLTASGKGHYAKSLYNDYVYFWRWAIWKVCQQPMQRAEAEAAAAGIPLDPSTVDQSGIVSFITASSYMSGQAFRGMRKVMRQQFDEIWVIDLGGDGRGTRQNDNVFDGVLTSVAIAVGIRLPDQDAASRSTTPAEVRYRSVTGTRDEKYTALDGFKVLDSSDDAWAVSSSDWEDPFLPAGTEDFDTWPLLTDLMPWRETGTHFYRSWPIAESAAVLQDRWDRLVAAQPEERPALLKESRDRKAHKQYKDITTGTALTTISTLGPTAPVTPPRRLGFRSFDRQWCLADNRVGDYIRPQLWRASGPRQVYFQTLTTSPLGDGPALHPFADVPDCHGFRGSYGDKGVMPLWRDAGATKPNITKGVLDVLGEKYDRTVTPEEFAAYLYGLLGTDAYTASFTEELGSLGPRIPFTTDVALFDRAVTLGRDLLWWHTYGERFQPQDARGKALKRLPAGSAKNTKAVPNTADDYPKEFEYDRATNTLSVGTGRFSPVAPEVWDFQVSGLKVLQSWLGYRMKARAGKASSDLDNTRPATWTFSGELLTLLAILEHTVARTSEAVELLEEIVAGAVLVASDFPEPSEDELTYEKVEQEAGATLFDQQ